MLTVRVELTKAEWRELRQLALEQDVTVQALAGSVLVDYLRANGVETDQEAGVA